MRISMVIKNMHGGGAERVALSLLGQFIDEGHVVQLVLFERKGELLDDIPKAVQLIVLDSSPALFAALNPLSGLRKWMQSLKRWGDADTVVCFSYKVNIAVTLAGLMEKVQTPIILTEHNVFSKDIAERNILRRFYLLTMSRWLYPKAAAWVAVSDFVKQDAMRLNLLSERQAHVIYNPVIVKKTDAESSPSEWDRDDKISMILSVGSFFKVKDYSTLIRAFALLHNRRPETRLVMLGEGGQRERLQKLIDELGLFDYVSMPGFCNPKTYMDRAGLLAISSRHESFSLVAAEALSCGLNVVSTDCGGPADILEHGRYGRLVPVGDADAFADAMEKTLDNPLPPELLKKRAFDFSLQRIADEYLELIDKTIRQYRMRYDNDDADIKNTEKILWVELGGIGDVAQGIADIKLLKGRHPGVEVWMLTKPQWKDFVSSQPSVDGVIVGDKKPFKVLLSTARQIRKYKFDRMSDISAGGGHSLMLQMFCRVPYLLPLTTKRPREEAALDISEESRRRAEDLLKSLPDKRVFVCIGSGGTSLKLWPVENWIRFLSDLIEAGWGVVLNGHGQEEKNIAAQICGELAAERCVDLVDLVALEDIPAVAKACTAAVGNDTGPLHLAALSGVPTLGIFSYPTSWRVGLRMPWFADVTATNELKKFRWENKDTRYILDTIRPERIMQEFRQLQKRANGDTLYASQMDK